MRYAVLLAALACIAAPLASAQQPEIVTLETRAGQIAIELFWDDAPRHAANFADLASEGFYDGTVFHRIIPGFMIQGGDPLTREGEATMERWGTGGPPDSLDQEFNDIQHVRGIVSMARSADPDSAGSQFFIVHADSGFLDGQYTVFGRVVTQEGLDALDTIALLPTGPADRPIDWQAAVIESVRPVPASELNMLELGEPARTAPPPTAAPARYDSEDLEFSFEPPVGWLLQEPTGEDAPDVVVLMPGPELPPAISFTVRQAEGRTLDDLVAAKAEELEPAVESGALTVLSTRERAIGGLDASVLSVRSDLFETGIRFTEATAVSGERIYLITYTAAEPDHDRYLADYEAVLSSVEFAGVSQPGGGCLIATAAHGTELAPAVQRLREVREGLAGTGAGSAFLSAFNHAYYSFSPAVADLERQSPELRALVRAAAAPMVLALGIVSPAQTEAQFVALGVLALLANAAMYAGAPAAAVLVTKSLGRRALARPRASAS